jgi:hypothetical protein
MKKFISLLVLVCVGITANALATSYNVNVGTNSVVLVPRPAAQAAEWSTNTVYSQGSFVSSSSIVYWTNNGGTSSTNVVAAPSHGSGAATGSDSITWIRIPEKAWSEVYVYTPASTVTIDFDQEAVSGTGYLLNTREVFTDWHDTLYAEATTNTSVRVTVH